MSQDHDNSNDVALWSANGYRGYGQVNGVTVNVTFVKNEKASGGKPVGDLYIHYYDKQTKITSVDHVPVFERDGKFGGQTATHWVNMWINKGAQGNQPPLKFFFSLKDAQPVASTTQYDPVAEQDTVPF